MKKVEKIITVLAVVGLIALTIMVEVRHYKQNKFYEHVDSTLVETDSMLQHAQRNIDSTKVLLQELEQYQ